MYVCIDAKGIFIEAKTYVCVKIEFSKALVDKKVFVFCVCMCVCGVC